MDKGGHVDIYSGFRGFDTYPHELLKTIHLVMVLAEIYSGGKILFFVIGHNELFCLMSLKGLFLACYCGLYINNISTDTDSEIRPQMTVFAIVTLEMQRIH